MVLKRLGMLLFCAVLLASGLSCIQAHAADYPASDIKHIMPWSAGGGTDTVMRAFMNSLEKAMGATIYTVNLPGAKSGQGVAELMQSAADGYTLGTVTYDSLVTVPYFGLVPGYDIARLRFIGTVTGHPTVIAVSAKAPWKTMEDLIEDARKCPGEIPVSNVGLGGVWHLPVLDLEQVAGIKFRHVVFPGGSAEQREALLKREVPVACTSIGGVYPAIKAGHVRVLAVMGSERMTEFPDVPTFKELGYDLDWGSVRAIAVPKDVPEEICAELEEGCRKVTEDDKWQKWLAESGGGGWIWRNGEQTTQDAQALQEKVFKLMDELVAEGVISKSK